MNKKDLSAMLLASAFGSVAFVVGNPQLDRVD